MLRAAGLPLLQMRDPSAFKFEAAPPHPILKAPCLEESGQTINLLFYGNISFKSQAYFHTLANLKIGMGVYSHG